MHLNLLRLITLLWCGWVAAGESASSQEIAPKQPAAETGRTAKERLSSKAADEQRVDNCKVPVESRGAKPRPDGCAHDVNRDSK